MLYIEITISYFSAQVSAVNLKAIAVLLGCLVIPPAMAGENIIRTYAPIKGASSTVKPQLDLYRAELVEGLQGTPYTYNFSRAAYWVVPPKGPAPAFVWSATPPAGLNFSSTGLLSGTPNSSGTFAIPVTVQAAGQSATRTYTLYVEAPAARFELFDAELPDAQKGTTYSFDFAYLAEWMVLPPEGTDRSFTWSAITPPGLTMSSSGVLSGTPTTSGDLVVSVTVTAAGKTLTHDYTLTVNAPAANLELLDATLSQGTVQNGYSYDFNSLAHWLVAPQPGDVTPFSWSATSVPPGLTLSTAGLLSGTPSTQGNYNLTITLTGSGKTATHSYALQVMAPSTLTCKDIKASSPGAASGVYTLSLNGVQLKAYCEMASDGGGWTLIGRGAPNAVGAWATTTGDVSLPAVPSPTSATSFKFADATINALPKSAYKVMTTGYNNLRYFKPTCVYSHLAIPQGDCAISYATESWTGARGNGLSVVGAGGLTDHRASVPNDGYFVLTSLTQATTSGWAAGNGTTSTYLGTGIAGTIIGLTMWVR
jgi:hypothetical protein